MKKFLALALAAIMIVCALSIHAFAAVAYVSFNLGNNDAYDGLTPETPKKGLQTFESNAAISVIGIEGGTLVVVERLYIGTNYTFPAMTGPLTITGAYNGVNYVNADNVDNPEGGMMKAGSGKTVTLGTDTILDNIILFQQDSQNNLVIPAGITCTMTDTVQIMTRTGNEHYWMVTVEPGGTLICTEEAQEKLDIVNLGGTVETYQKAAATGVEIKMTVNSKTAYVNGEAKTLDAEPIIRQNRTMLPVRFVAENLGATVAWDGNTSTATVTGNGVVIEITIGATTAKVNGEAVDLDSPAFIENNRTYLPVRFVAEKLGATVGWDGATSTATLTK